MDPAGASMVARFTWLCNGGPAARPAGHVCACIPLLLLGVILRLAPEVLAGEEAADIHALRHTFGMHLGKNGLARRTAQAAMRHAPPHSTLPWTSTPTPYYWTWDVLAGLPIKDTSARKAPTTASVGAWTPKSLPR